uniref:Origin recognition complex subunit 4 n=1 Tax=Mesocestoides corti TaxID=53468 RepID=A0A5K3EZ61_MESCO
MEAIKAFLRDRIFTSSHEPRFPEKDIASVFNTIRDTVVNGVSNSMLIIGRRGSGKSHLLREAIKRAKLDAEVKSNIIEVYINGLIHTNDRIALHTIAKQLQRVCPSVSEAELIKREEEELTVDESDEDKENALVESRIRNFSDQMRWLLSGLRAGDSVASKALVVVLDEFDLFATHRNQALLYNLFDTSCHADGTPVCVIGVTCRLDVMEMLEKRVKSRFSHRQLHVVSVAAPLYEDTSMADDNTQEEEEEDDTTQGASRPFKRYCDVARSLLTVHSAKELAEFAQSNVNFHSLTKWKLHKAVGDWNAHVNEFFESEIVTDCLRQTWEVSTCIGKLRNVMALLIARLDQSKSTLDAEDFIEVLSRLRQDAKTALLPSLSLLELILITTMVKLHEIREGEPLNFEVVFRGNCLKCKGFPWFFVVVNIIICAANALSLFHVYCNWGYSLAFSPQNTHVSANRIARATCMKKPWFRRHWIVS